MGQAATTKCAPAHACESVICRHRRPPTRSGGLRKPFLCPFEMRMKPTR